MKKLFSIIIVALPVLLMAQTAERQVIGSAGGSVTATGLQVSNTVGETITVTATSSSVILTQGFQQASTGSVGIEDVELGFAMKAYPSPTSGTVTLDFSVEKEQQLSIAVFDMQGRQVLPAQKLHIKDKMLHSINMESIAPGNYFIHLFNETGKLDKSIQINKID